MDWIKQMSKTMAKKKTKSEYDVVDEVMAQNAIGTECDISKNRQWLFDHYFHEVFGPENGNTSWMVPICFSRQFLHRFKNFCVKDFCDYVKFDVDVYFEFKCESDDDSYHGCLYHSQISPKKFNGDMFNTLRSNFMENDIYDMFEVSMPADCLNGFVANTAEEAVKQAVAYGIRAMESIRMRFEAQYKRKAFVFR